VDGLPCFTLCVAGLNPRIRLALRQQRIPEMTCSSIKSVVADTVHFQFLLALSCPSVLVTNKQQVTAHCLVGLYPKNRLVLTPNFMHVMLLRSAVEYCCSAAVWGSVEVQCSYAVLLLSGAGLLC
jgi:hypothetical protein